MAQTLRPTDPKVLFSAAVQAKLAACSKVVGESYFPVMVEALAELLMARWVLLCKLDPVDRGKACTVTFWDNGPAENFEYLLENTPCANIVSQGACCFPDNITGLFPHDQMLKDIGANGYVGTPLQSSSGEVVGLLSVMDEKPIENPDQVIEIISLFSGRAASELERLATTSLNERLGRIVEDSASEVYIFDANTYQFVLVNRGARENLGYSIDELRQLTPWDIKPQFTKDEFIQYVTPLRNGKVAKQQFETLHERKDGSIYKVAVQLQFFPGVDNLFYAAINDVTDQKRAEEAQAHLAAIIASSNEAIISKSMNGKVKSWNKGAEQIFGYCAEEIIGKSIRRLIPPDLQEEEDDILSRISQAEQISNYETVRIRRDGRVVDVSVTVSPIFDSRGKIIGASNIAHDISDRKIAEAREKLLVGEINHRAKNMLALVQVIARQTAAKDSKTFIQRFEERILALSAAHDVLVNSGWQDVPFEELARSQLGHLMESFGERIKLNGPAVKINARAAQAIGMALHELATNAAKYGALSNDDGTIDIVWELKQIESAAFIFAISWSEQGGPEIEKPNKTGFGSTVIERILAASLDGQVTQNWRSSGLVCEMSCLADKILGSPETWVKKSDAVIESKFSPKEQNRRILVVEDEILIGLEISDIIKEAGYEIIGPVASVDSALDLLQSQMCDAAVLDINLGQETSAPVAEMLSEMGVPYLSISARNIEDRPAEFFGTPHIPKPIRPAILVKEVGQMLGCVDKFEPLIG